MTTSKQQQITNRNNLHSARKSLLAWQPEAMYVRLEGKCGNCKRSGGFVSYQLPDDLPGGAWYKERKDGMESCGFHCVHCEFSNAGARKVEE